jgi:hypothetical protein
VNLHVAELKPQARKAERGPRYWRHSKQINIEPPRRFQIRADERDMVEGGRLDYGAFWHTPIIAQSMSRRRRTSGATGSASAHMALALQSLTRLLSPPNASN